MTVTAHSRRRFHGSNEEPTPPTCLDRDKFSLRMLEPWLYNDIPSSKLPKPQLVKRPPKPQPERKDPQPASTPPNIITGETIFLWLKNNGWATAPEMAVALNRKRPESITRLLRQGIDGIEVKHWRRANVCKPVQVWGVIGNGVS